MVTLQATKAGWFELVVQTSALRHQGDRVKAKSREFEYLWCLKVVLELELVVVRDASCTA